MADKMTPEQRHKCMSHIRGKDTRPEMIVRRYLFAHGYRYRLHEMRLPGTPDIVMRRLHTVIMVNGCFWHGHEGCRYFVLPRTNSDFWLAKIERNRARDAEQRTKLRAKGWNVIQIWECELKPSVRQATLQRLTYTLSRIELGIIGHKRPKAYNFGEGEPPTRMVADEGREPNL
ncbi:MAG: DNA mismatch endonuclease Vsr [Bacteroidales bacterium]|nr:DNA mismatch endonuclease Vsr [Bacteroidales bacterium]